jgi:site-specific DNA-adenine methylase
MRHANHSAATLGIEAISIAQYGGRKQWFLPYALRYFQAHRCKTLIESFAGSGIVGLSLLHAGVIERLVLVEKDERLVTLHQGVISDPTLIDKYAAFACTHENIRRLLATETTAFRYLVQSRTRNRGRFNGGVCRPADRHWCREHVLRNLRLIYEMRDRIEVIHGDALEVMRQYVNDSSTGAFADPPYSSESQGAGHQHYRHKFAGRHNHKELFRLLSHWRGAWLLTEDNCRTVRHLALAYRFSFRRVRMNSAENRWKKELMVWRKRRIF